MVRDGCVAEVDLAGAVVERRHQQDLTGDLQVPALAGEDGQRRRHPAAGAVAHHAARPESTLNSAAWSSSQRNAAIGAVAGSRRQSCACRRFRYLSATAAVGAAVTAAS
jgi:hypothetical protein